MEKLRKEIENGQLELYKRYSLYASEVCTIYDHYRSTPCSMIGVAFELGFARGRRAEKNAQKKAAKTRAARAAAK